MNEPKPAARGELPPRIIDESGRAAPPAPAERGAWMQTYRGGAFFLLEPQSSAIEIEDIAHALANTCRFNGHCRAFYSVAQHSVMVSELVVGILAARGELPPRLIDESGRAAPPAGKQADLGAPRFRMAALAGLLHDAAEAYIGDVVTPLKGLLPDFARIERRVEEAIAARFGLGMILADRARVSSIRDAVKRADQVALATERRDLLNAAPFAWAALPEPRVTPISPWLPSKARERFLSRYFALVEGWS